ncbi:MAG: hypothetical protein LBJ00_01025 [Planctomycetaceae bacterium]|jgi:hypothetical protein|nr:hypothetical protein [Planctomycetaceae bacterium]
MKTAKQLGDEAAQPMLQFSENRAAREEPPYEIQTSIGLTKREYFAGLALQGLLSNPERYKYIAALVDSGKLSQQEASDKNAHKAVLIADSLLNELSR